MLNPSPSRHNPQNTDVAERTSFLLDRVALRGYSYSQEHLGRQWKGIRHHLSIYRREEAQYHGFCKKWMWWWRAWKIQEGILGYVWRKLLYWLEDTFFNFMTLVLIIVDLCTGTVLTIIACMSLPNHRRLAGCKLKKLGFEKIFAPGSGSISKARPHCLFWYSR